MGLYRICLADFLGMLCLVPGLSGCAQNSQKSAEVGIWKAIAPKDMQGEFGKHDVLGLVSGHRIPTDCSINWLDPDDGKRYCFSSGTSLLYFQEQPKTNIRRATEVWENMKIDSSEFMG